jgi:transcriptional regulator with XRE-family HTH domain
MSVADVGPDGRVVADNIKRIRHVREISLREMESRLRELGRPIHATGLVRIEQYQRRVDIDDLAAIAEVLGVPPARLLAAGDYAEDMHRELLERLDRIERMLIDDGQRRLDPA